MYINMSSMSTDLTSDCPEQHQSFAVLLTKMIVMISFGFLCFALGTFVNSAKWFDSQLAIIHKANMAVPLKSVQIDMNGGNNNNNNNNSNNNKRDSNKREKQKQSPHLSQQQQQKRTLQQDRQNLALQQQQQQQRYNVADNPRRGYPTNSKKLDQKRPMFHQFDEENVQHNIRLTDIADQLNTDDETVFDVPLQQQYEGDDDQQQQQEDEEEQHDVNDEEYQDTSSSAIHIVKRDF
jgi:hypothetical protein